MKGAQTAYQHDLHGMDFQLPCNTDTSPGFWDIDELKPVRTKLQYPITEIDVSRFKQLTIFAANL